MWCVVWRGTVRFGAVWCGLVRCGVVWCGFGMASLVLGLVWFGVGSCRFASPRFVQFVPLSHFGFDGLCVRACVHVVNVAPATAVTPELTSVFFFLCVFFCARLRCCASLVLFGLAEAFRGWKQGRAKPRSCRLWLDDSNSRFSIDKENRSCWSL